MRKAVVVLAALAAGLGGLWWWLQERAPRGWDAPTLPELVMEAPAEVWIDQGEGRVVLRQRDGVWWIEEPAPYRASTMHMEDILALVQTPLVSDLTRDAGAHGAALGVVEGGEVSPIRVVFRGQGGEQIDLWVGQRVEVERTRRALTWVRPEGSDTAYRVGGNLRSALELAPADLRERRLWELAAEDVAELRFSRGERVLTLRPAEGTWQVVTEGGETLEADGGHIRALLRDLSNLRVQGFLEDKTPEEVGLHPESPRVTLRAGGQTLQATLGGTRDAEDIGVGAVSFPLAVEGITVGLYPLVTEHQAAWFDQGLGDLLGRQVLRVEEASLQRVVLPGADAGRDVTLARDAEGSWRVFRGRVVGAGEAVSGAALEAFLETLTNLRASRWEDELLVAGDAFDGQTQELRWQAADGSEGRIVLGGDAASRYSLRGGRWARRDDGRPFVLTREHARRLTDVGAWIPDEG